MALCLMGHIHPLPGGLGAVNQPHLPIDVHRPGGYLPRPWPGAIGLARSSVGVWVLSMANCNDKAMDTLGTLWKSTSEVVLSPSAFHSF